MESIIDFINTSIDKCEKSEIELCSTEWRKSKSALEILFMANKFIWRFIYQIWTNMEWKWGCVSVGFLKFKPTVNISQIQILFCNRQHVFCFIFIWFFFFWFFATFWVLNFKWSFTMCQTYTFMWSDNFYNSRRVSSLRKYVWLHNKEMEMTQFKLFLIWVLDVCVKDFLGQ